MEFLNKIELKGIVGVSNTTGSACNFTVMTQYAYKSKDGCAIVDTLWWNCFAYNLPSSLSEKSPLQRGSKVHVIGRIRARRYCDAQGIDRTSHEVIVQDLKIMED